MGMGEENNIRQLVKGIDPRFDCRVNRRNGNYEITQTSPMGLVSLWGVLPWDGVNKEFFDNMRRTIYINRNGDPLREIEEHNQRIEKRREEKQGENIDYLTKSTAPAIHRAFREI
jgi:hypothetical protein